MRPSPICSTSRATALGALKENDNGEKAPLADLDGTSETDQKQCADKHLGTKFRKRGNPLYLAITPSAHRPARASRRSSPDAPRLCERQRSTSGAARSIAAGVRGDGTPAMEGAMAGDGMTVSRGVLMAVGSDGRPIEGEMEGHRDALSMCFRRFDAGPVSTLTILPAVNKRSMATRKASADTPFASVSPANSNGALPRPVLGRTGRP
jgi:hypothetical protein